MEKSKSNEIQTTSNSTVYNRLMRRQFSCTFCSPNCNENKKGWAYHGMQKPKYKDHRK